MTFEEQLHRTFDTLTNRIRDEVARQLDAVRAELAASAAGERIAAEERGREHGIEQGREAGREAGLEAGREAARADLRISELAASERLADAIRAMDRARSLSEILDTLARCAGREVARVGVLLVRGASVHGWQFIGFGPALGEASQFELRLDDAGIIGEAVRTAVAASGDNGAQASAPAFADLPAGREMLALPVPMSGQVVAVLYADQGAETADPEVRVAWPATLEVMARHAARCLEAVTAFRAAQILTERPDVPSSPLSSAQAHSAGGGSADEAAEEEQAARRYARLLISEIKLYHEAEVAAGRRERDLVTRLGGEIARARALYEERVPVSIRRSADHFQAELVRTLANGDASLVEQKS